MISREMGFKPCDCYDNALGDEILLRRRRRHRNPREEIEYQTFRASDGQLLELYDAEEATCDERCDALAH